MSVDADACVIVWTTELKVLFKCEVLTCVQPAYLPKLKIFASNVAIFAKTLIVAMKTTRDFELFEQPLCRCWLLDFESPQDQTAV